MDTLKLAEQFSALKGISNTIRVGVGVISSGDDTRLTLPQPTPLVLTQPLPS